MLNSSAFESVNGTFSLISRVEDAPSSLASYSMPPTKRDGAVGSEQRVPQFPNDSITREAKIALKKKIDMKKKTGSTYGQMNVQMVYDPLGEMNDPAHYVVQYCITIQI